ncbi:hypothetical protein DFR52_1011193 [Hoeflea marina]|uniref:Pentapeptide MXKDX repeat protein n=1 Tax=Hoeflea marina TaxID=274592 RepID=A0A317PUX7_9HYPH|nr:hypothetical protein [Hoeflea marina]PWW04494.1 hypothetical protein DFR52_1011193 [Hoeflea marina]
MKTLLAVMTAVVLAGVPAHAFASTDVPLTSGASSGESPDDSGVESDNGGSDDSAGAESESGDHDSGGDHGGEGGDHESGGDHEGGESDS